MSADEKSSRWSNGKESGSGADWMSPGHFRVGEHLRTGVNLIAVRAENLPAPVTQNPAGLNVSLEVQSVDHVSSTIRSDASWRVSKSAAPGWNEPSFDDSSWA